MFNLTCKDISFPNYRCLKPDNELMPKTLCMQRKGKTEITVKEKHLEFKILIFACLLISSSRYRKEPRKAHSKEYQNQLLKGLNLTYLLK
jgi:hypothetical protein